MDMNKWIKQKECDICHDQIGLYTPWYSVSVKGRLCIPKLKNNPMCLCRNCFQAYEHFLIEQETHENHKRNYLEMKGER